MLLTSEELLKKEIINTVDGSSLGFAEDILFDTETKKIIALVVNIRPKIFGIFGGNESISIGWEKIVTVGKDTILIKTEQCGKIYNENKNFIQKILDIFLY
ncbi:MAG: YlmC/YmxH family sporulation protein [Oscillospiraceae bacterium]|nr:YlmC/YmxH family sporulation protein [Oscillospiraceae bacterium]